MNFNLVKIFKSKFSSPIKSSLDIFAKSGNCVLLFIEYKLIFLASPNSCLIFFII